VLFSIVPLAIVLVSVLGLVLQNDELRHDVTKTIVDALPVSEAGKHDVEDAVTAIATPFSAAGLVSLLVFAWAASGMMGAIRGGLESALGVTRARPMARGKLIDLLLIVGAAGLVLVTAGITVVGQLVHTAGGGVASATDIGAGTLSDGLVRVAAFALSILVVLLLYRFVPARGLRIRDGLAGAIVTAIFFELIALASSTRCTSTRRRSSSARRSRPRGRGPPPVPGRRWQRSSSARSSASSSSRRPSRRRASRLRPVRLRRCPDVRHSRSRSASSERSC
jgi:YihY family inner membrane protein